MMTGGLLNKDSATSQVAKVDTVESEAQQEVKEAILAEDAPNKNTLQKDVKKKTMMQDGVTIEIKKEGIGDAVKVGQTAVVHYTGMFTDGKVFDSSIPRGQTFPVQLGAGMVIQGWEKGLVGMKKGEQRRLTIPPELGYGAAGAGNIIPPNTTLIFDVELIDIK